MSAFVEPDGTINPIFSSYHIYNNANKHPTRDETPSLRKKTDSSP